MGVKPVHRAFGLCYTLSEALYYALGGRSSGLKPMRATGHGVSHWWLETPKGRIIDLTRGQFTSRFPYERGRYCPFMSKRMFKATRKFLRPSP